MTYYQDQKEKQQRIIETMTPDQVWGEFYRFITQRPGIDPANYGGYMSGYYSDRHIATRDRNRALNALRIARYGNEVDAEKLAGALASQGRLEFDENGTLKYTTGQYFPTEYRGAACAALTYYYRSV